MFAHACLSQYLGGSRQEFTQPRNAIVPNRELLPTKSVDFFLISLQTDSKNNDT